MKMKGWCWFYKNNRPNSRNANAVYGHFLIDNRYGQRRLHGNNCFSDLSWRM